MRTIKFRVYDFKKKGMFQVADLWLNEESEISDVAYRVRKTVKTIFSNRDKFELMQFTGLLDKNDTCKEVYEDDILDKNGKVIGNKYETPTLLKDPTNFLIQGFGTETWEATNREAMGRGCFYSERYASEDEVRELE